MKLKTDKEFVTATVELEDGDFVLSKVATSKIRELLAKGVEVKKGKFPQTLLVGEYNILESHFEKEKSGK
jgi:hypothetical protein